MKSHVLAVTTSAIILACGTISGSAQQMPGGPMMQQPDQPQSHQHEDTAGRGGGGMMCGEMMRHGGMMGREMMGGGMGDRGMMPHGTMGHRGMMDPLAMRMIFALMDSDGDGTVSLQEFQAAHEKIFKAMDANKDGVLSMEEMQAFMHGGRKPVPQH
jgi:hypothetical protein